MLLLHVCMVGTGAECWHECEEDHVDDHQREDKQTGGPFREWNVWRICHVLPLIPELKRGFSRFTGDIKIELSEAIEEKKFLYTSEIC